MDLETGVIDETMGPEVRVQKLFRDRLVGVVRAGHPLARGEVRLLRYAGGRHVSVSRRGGSQRLIEEALAEHELERDVAVIVGGFGAAVALARNSDLIATVPERHTGNLRSGMHSFPLPFPTPEFTVSMLWHPRLDADFTHRWLRGIVSEVCTR